MYTVEEVVNDLNISRLRELCRMAGFDETIYVPSCMRFLISFYSDSENLVKVYEQLPPGEQKLINHFVWANSFPNLDIVESIVNAHHMKAANSSAYNCCNPLAIRQYMPDNSLSQLLIPNRMPFFIRKVLSAHLPPEKIGDDVQEYVPLESEKVICRENRALDFVYMAAYCISNNVATSNGMQTKTVFAKLLETGNWEDCVESKGRFCLPKQALKPSNFKITSAMYLIAVNCSLFGENSPLDLIKEEPVQFLEEALRCYESHQALSEQVLLPGFKYEGAYWKFARTGIKDVLKSLPIGKFVSFSRFETLVKTIANSFMTGFIGRAKVHRPEGDFEVSWIENERRALQVLLCSFCALGMIDLSFKESDADPSKEDPSNSEASAEISGIRLNSLGAYLLGMIPEYKPKDSPAEAGFVVNPDFCIIVDGVNSKMAHAPFFGNLMSRIQDDANTATYKLDFASFAKALDQGMPGKRFKEYLEANSSRPVPDNVLKTIDSWIERSGKLRIRTITVLESDDEFLLAEIENMKAMDKFKMQRLGYSIVIKPDQAKKIKGVLDKAGKHVDLEM